MRLSTIHFFVRRLFRRTGAEEDLQAELQSHLDLDIRLPMERGDSADSARQAALREHVFRSILADGFRLTMLGLFVGLAGVFFLVRYLRSLLFEVQPSDPLTLCSVVGLIAATGLLACYWPARRATKVDLHSHCAKGDVGTSLVLFR
ncbi:MAG TPA: hypothetical protein VH351_02995 [Bryobacteraceae bacterium]|nr:hypothetical protein [Bryobacteraceae bacterium]